jgi:hypothetical protein
MSLPLEPSVHRELAEQCRGHRVRAVPLQRSGQKRALDLRCAQGDIACDSSGRRICDDVDARYAINLIGPRVPEEPGVQRVSAAIKQAPVVSLGQRSWWGNERDRSAFPGRGSAREFGQCGNFLRRAPDPGLERVPILRGNADNCAIEHRGLGRLQCSATHELAEARMRLFRCCLKDSAFGRVDTNAENRGVRSGYHVYDNSIQTVDAQDILPIGTLSNPAPNRSRSEAAPRRSTPAGSRRKPLSHRVGSHRWRPRYAA